MVPFARISRRTTSIPRLSMSRIAEVLTDEDADKIRKGVESGLRGPVVIKWIRKLLDDRDERLGRPKYEAPKVTGRALRRPRRRSR